MQSKTPAAWLTYLEQKLANQQREIQIFEDYYDGNHRLAFASKRFRQAFGTLFAAFADNWCESVVDAPVERLEVLGFRFEKEGPADDTAWEIWQASGMDAESDMLHTEAIKSGRAYTIVGAPEERDGPPRISVEHPAQVVVEHAPGNRRRRLAALKKWRDEEGYEYATVYLPEWVYKWRTKEKIRSAMVGESRNWIPRPGDEGGSNPLGVVPVVPFYNNPTILAGGRSDLLPAIPLQDAINKEIADMLVASEFAALPQRWATGVEVPTDDSGSPLPVAEMKALISAIWTNPSKEAKFGQFQAADLGNYVKAVTVLLQHLAAQTRTPPHYLLGEIVNASGDALKAAETGLVARTKRKHKPFGESHEETERLGFLAMGDTERFAKSKGAETIWKDPEYRSEAEQVDAAIKLKALEIPKKALWERVGASQEEIKRWEAEPAPPIEEKVNVTERAIQ